MHLPRSSISTRLTDPLLRLPTCLLQCCIRGAQGGEICMRGLFVFLLEASRCLRQPLFVLVLFKEPRLTLQFISIRDPFWGKNSSLWISLVCTLFPAQRKKRATSQETSKAHADATNIMWAPCGLFVLVCAETLAFHFLPSCMWTEQLQVKWMAERWRGGGAAAQWWLCNWLLYLWSLR